MEKRANDLSKWHRNLLRKDKKIYGITADEMNDFLYCNHDNEHGIAYIRSKLGLVGHKSYCGDVVHFDNLDDVS